MRLVDRLYQFIEYKGLSAYAFERTCELSNGYLNKQSRGNGGMGSEVLEKIHRVFPELSLIWLISGKGKMLFEEEKELNDAAKAYQSASDEMLDLLKDKIRLLEKANADKDKIIALMERHQKKPSR